MQSQRRRGQELEDALLQAAWEELLAVGYGGFTIEGVAARAGTSRPVLYRRWPNRADLAVAALRYHGRTEPVVVPDTGSLREDLIQVLRNAWKGRMELAVLFSVQMGQFFAETGTSPAKLREDFLSSRPQPSGMQRIIDRAVERGEIDPARLTERIASLPSDLLRHEMLMTLAPVPDEVILEIVDSIFLPLVRPTGS
ncbi:TetR/AcrR family transcriptional regulator [Asanoa sp. NPDC049573]|uniref:TetR/AcrR family transcriptional regulator n=1 Tax=Asanoa sp. NPDC049573 TaxID=3155396 RepID=UPI0034213CE7